LSRMQKRIQNPKIVAPCLTSGDATYILDIFKRQFVGLSSSIRRFLSHSETIFFLLPQDLARYPVQHAPSNFWWKYDSCSRNRVDLSPVRGTIPLRSSGRLATEFPKGSKTRFYGLPSMETLVFQSGHPVIGFLVLGQSAGDLHHMSLLKRCEVDFGVSLGGKQCTL